ncbi:uncharacterized protein [Leptinotarsa decemlineata]|uniref:uncharacterized protein n=1 Tax=Leptinotarsa decemlineata TaxID=7539 RepID=UPI000C253DEF|nr:testicular haploid expressed gene protein [Leptinotarsa decemlineata]
MPKSILKGNRGSNIPDDFRKINAEDILKKPTLKKKGKKNAQMRPITAPNQLSHTISHLAEPKRRYSENCDDSHWAIKKSTLNYKATRRIKNLAQPKSISPKIKDTSSSFISPKSSVTPSALKYKPSRRIMDLAKPKDWIYYEHYD